MPLYRLLRRSFIHGGIREGGEIVHLHEHEASEHMVLVENGDAEASAWEAAQQKRLADQQAKLAEISATAALPEDATTVAECESRINTLQGVDDAHFEFTAAAVAARQAAIASLMGQRSVMIAAELAAKKAEEERVAGENPNLVATNVFFGRFQPTQLAAIAESPLDNPKMVELRGERRVDLGDPTVKTWLDGLVARALVPQSQAAEIVKPVEKPAKVKQAEEDRAAAEAKAEARRVEGERRTFSQGETMAAVPGEVVRNPAPALTSPAADAPKR